MKNRGRQNVVCMLPPTPEHTRTLDWNEIAALEGLTNFGSTPFWAMRGEEPEKYVALLPANRCPSYRANGRNLPGRLS